MAESRPADTPDTDTPVPTSDVPAVPPGPDLDPEQERMLFGFYADPAQYPELNDGGADLPRSVSPMLATLSEWAHRVAGSGVDVQTLEGRPQALLKAAAFFVNRALLAPRGSHYRVLGLNANASASEIHDHYRYLRRLFSVADADGTAHAAVMRVSEAYVVLRDPARRRAYDASVFGSSALPRLEAERRGTTEGRQRFSTAPAAGYGTRWVRVAAVFALVLGLFWWFGGFDEPAVETPVTLAPDTETGSPETAGTTAPSQESAETATAASDAAAPQTDAAAPQGGVVAGVDEALLDRVEGFAGEQQQPDSAGAGTSAPSTATQAPETAAPVSEAEQAETPAETDAAPSELPGTSEAASAATSAQSDTGSPTTVGESDAASTETAPEAESAAAASTAAPEPEVAVIPVTPEATPDTAPPAPKPAAELEQLLARADRQLAAGQLTTPVGNSAADSYREVLRRDPGNVRATQGMSAIADRYAMLARYRLRRDELSEARTMIARGLELTPGHSGLLAASADIDARSDALAAARTQAQDPRRDEPTSAPGTGLSIITSARPSSAPAASGEAARPLTGAAAPSTSTPSISTSGTPPLSSSPSSSGATSSSSSSPSTTATGSSGVATASAPPPIRPVPPDSSLSATTNAAQSPSIVASVAPPPAAGSTPPAPQSLKPDAPLSDRALNELVAKFVRYYEGGDLEAFMELFALDAETNSRKGAKGIRQDYMSLFTGSQSRLMRLKDLRWSRPDNEAVGEADFNLSLFGRRESRPNAYEGRLTFRVVEVNGEPVIKGLFHSQRKLDDG